MNNKQGYRNQADAPACSPEILKTQAERASQWASKDQAYKEYELLHPGEVKDIKNFEQYKIFWRDWICTCPAWISQYETCGAMAIIVHRDDEGILIYCPECNYAGEHFARPKHA